MTMSLPNKCLLIKDFNFPLMWLIMEIVLFLSKLLIDHLLISMKFIKKSRDMVLWIIITFKEFNLLQWELIWCILILVLLLIQNNSMINKVVNIISYLLNKYCNPNQWFRIQQWLKLIQNHRILFWSQSKWFLFIKLSKLFKREIMSWLKLIIKLLIYLGRLDKYKGNWKRKIMNC